MLPTGWRGSKVTLSRGWVENGKRGLHCHSIARTNTPTVLFRRKTNSKIGVGAIVGLRQRFGSNGLSGPGSASTSLPENEWKWMIHAQQPNSNSSRSRKMGKMVKLCSRIYISEERGVYVNKLRENCQPCVLSLSHKEFFNCKTPRKQGKKENRRQNVHKTG